jgi:hypothetical protein
MGSVLSAWASRIAGLSTLALVVACGDSSPSEPPPEAVPIRLALVEPGVCRAGEPLEGGLVVRVLELYSDQPVAGVEVDFQVLQGHPGLAMSSTTSNADGVAGVELTCAPQLGTTMILVSANGGDAQVPTLFHTLAGPPARFYRFEPPEGTPVLAGQALDLNAFLGDQFENPVSRVTVTWAIGSGGGSLARSSNETSDPAGFAPNTWYLGPEAGTQSLVLSVPGTNISQTYAVPVSAQAVVRGAEP